MRKVLVLAVGVLALAGAGCNPTSPYAARVNGGTISQGDLNNELTAIRSDPAYLNQIQSQSQVIGAGQDSFDSSFVAQVLNRQIVFELVHQEAARRGIGVGNDGVDYHLHVAAHWRDTGNLILFDDVDDKGGSGLRLHPRLQAGVGVAGGSHR